MPKRLFNAALIFLGASTSLYFTADVMAKLSELFWPALLFGLLQFLIGLVIALILYKFLRLDLVTSILGCATAGFTQMSSIAMEIEGADAVSVSVLQSVRMMVVITFVPLLLFRFL